MYRSYSVILALFLIKAGAASSDLTGKACSPNTIHWAYDTWAMGNSTGMISVLTGGKRWFFITADYVFGQTLERDTEAAVRQSRGTVVGKVRYPFPATKDFTPFLQQAMASRAQIVGLANAGADAINAIRQGVKLGVGNTSGQQFAGLLVFITDVNTLGLEAAQGLVLTESFYWDLNPRTREWSRRFFSKQKRMPTMIQAGVYASVLHYLKAVESLGTDDGTRVIAKMKEIPTNDPLFGFGRVRKDGRKIHPMYLFEVKKPSESKAPWDYYKLRGIIPADQAFRPMKDGGCPLIK
jgi:branched-chain amino acid transport system substrate-binding protein